jgi:hypothetical protein
MPGFPVAFGYVQEPGGEGAGPGVHTITRLAVSEELGPHGFPTSARIEIGSEGGGTPDGGPELDIAVTPLAFGPALLRNDDGRTSHFPRAMVRYDAVDGRMGLGWIEWNQPDPG